MPVTTGSGESGWPYVLAGGVAAGAIDIIYACAYWKLKAGVPAQRILQSVAAGLLGRSASIQGGLRTAILGLALHFFIALTMAAVYFVVARRWALLWQRPIPMGALYGLWLYIAMRFIVVPLSKAGGGGGSADTLWVVLSVIVHMVGIGVPIALATSYAIKGR